MDIMVMDRCGAKIRICLGQCTRDRCTSEKHFQKILSTVVEDKTSNMQMTGVNRQLADMARWDDQGRGDNEMLRARSRCPCAIVFFSPQRNSPWAHILRFFSTRFVSNTDKGPLYHSPTPIPHPRHSKGGGWERCSARRGDPFFCSHKWYQGQLSWKRFVGGGRRRKRAPHHIGFT